MNSMDTSMTPGKSAWKPTPVADLSGIAKNRKIAQAETQAAGNNAYAGKMRDGQTAAYDTLNQNAGKGVSRSAKDQMFAAQQQATGSAEGAQAQAGIEAEDQMFNAGQDADYMGQVLGRLGNNFRQTMGINNANFGLNMTRQQGQWDLAKARQQSWNQIMLSLMSKLS